MRLEQVVQGTEPGEVGPVGAAVGAQRWDVAQEALDEGRVGLGDGLVEHVEMRGLVGEAPVGCLGAGRAQGVQRGARGDQLLAIRNRDRRTASSSSCILGR